MDFSVSFSDWHDLRAAQPVVLKPIETPAAPTFEEVLKEAVKADGPATMPEKETAPVKTVAPAPAAPATVVPPVRKSVVPHAPQNIVPAAAKKPQKDAAADLTPLITPSAAPGDRLNDVLSRTETTTSKPLYRTDSLKNARQTSPYTMSEKTYEKRRDATVAAPPDAKNAMPMDKVRRFSGRLKPVHTDGFSKSRDGVKKQTAKADSFQNAEEYGRAVRQRRIDSGELVDMTASNGGKIGYDRSLSPSTVNKNNSAAASWFPEAMTRTLDKYEALSKAKSQGMIVDSDI